MEISGKLKILHSDFSSSLLIFPANFSLWDSSKEYIWENCMFDYSLVTFSFLMFSGGSKGNIGKKRVNPHCVKRVHIRVFSCPIFLVLGVSPRKTCILRKASFCIRTDFRENQYTGIFFVTPIHHQIPPKPEMMWT